MSDDTKEAATTLKSIHATTLAPNGKPDQLERLIEQLVDRFRDGATADGKRPEPSMITAFRKLHDKIGCRRLHYFNDEAVDVQLPEPYQDGHMWQSDRLRQIANELVARLNENDAVVRVNPIQDTAGQRKDANDLETVFNSGLDFVKDRTGLNIQATLARDLVTKAFGVLHWRMADHMWPKLPEPEELDELPEGADRAKYIDRRNTYKTRKVKRYKERVEAHAERVKHSRARAGFPWMIECPQPDQFLYWEDRSLENGFGIVLVLREVGLLDYARELHKTDGLVISVNQANQRVPMYLERDAPAEWEPSGDMWGERIQIAELWTRDEYYELVSEGGTAGWELVKSCSHPYGMPPFAIAAAIENNEVDPALRWEPALEGMYRLKPTVDRSMSLFLTLGESVALPFYYLRRTGDGGPMLDDKGKVVQFTRNAAAAMKPPDGYEIAQLEFEVNPAFIEGVKFINEEFDKAAPATGQAEISTSTQPWTARIEQAQQNVEPKMLLGNIGNAISVMVRNMAQVMSLGRGEGGFEGDPVWVYARTDDGKTDMTTVVGVEPEKIRSLDITVDIEASSSAERITLQEHGRALLNDPKVGLTQEEFVKDYEGKPNADDVVAKRRADAAYTAYVLPGLIRQELAAWQGPQIIIGGDGNAIGPDGQPLDPASVLAANGYSVQNPPQPPGGGGAPGMPANPPLEAPGTIQLPGQVAG